MNHKVRIVILWLIAATPNPKNPGHQPDTWEVCRILRSTVSLDGHGDLSSGR